MADARYISDRVKKQLYALSGNECANPLCHNKLVYPDDNAKDDQICHIEAASPDGPRYNPNQTDDERRDFENLILLCHRCHDMIDNNPAKYTVELLKKWKQEHEAKYKNTNKDKVFSNSIPTGLMSRDKEVDILFNEITNNRFFNLIGVGGSGKSSLAYLMMQKHKESFNEIAYVVVNSQISIKESIVSRLNETLNLDFKENEDVYKKIVFSLENNFQATNPNLLILDFNEISNETKDFAKNINKLCPKHWNVLMISREYIDPSENIGKKNLTHHQDTIFLKELFLKRAGERYSTFADFDNLFTTIFYNPLLAEQLGFYLSKLPETKKIEQIKEILYGNKFKSKEMKGFAVQTNDSRSTIIDFLTKLIAYNSETLDQNEKELLRHFVLWQADFINYKVIKQLLKGVFDSYDDLDETLVKLSDRAILMTQSTDDGIIAYKLHGILAESLREQIDLSIENYPIYEQNIKQIDTHGNNSIDVNICIYTSYCIWGEKMNNIIKGQYIQVVFHRLLAMLLNDRKSALSHFYKSIEIGEKIPTNHPECQDELATTYTCLAYFVSTHLQDSESAKEYYNKAIIILEQISDNNPQYQNHLVLTYNDYALLQQTYFGNYQIARSYYQKAIEIGELITKDINHPQFLGPLALTYSNLGMSLQTYYGAFQLAEKYYQKAIKIGESVKDIDCFDTLALSYNNLGLLQQLYGNFQLAEEYYKKAIEIGESYTKETKDPQVSNIVAMAYSNLGLLYLDFPDDFKSAEKKVKHAIEICELITNNSGNPQFASNLARAYFNYGILQHLVSDDFQSAEKNYKKAIEIGTNVVKCAKNPTFLYFLVISYKIIGALQEDQLAEYNSANENYNKAIEIGEQLPKDNQEYQSELASAYHDIGFLLHYCIKDYASARKNYNKALEIREQLPINNQEHLNDLAWTYHHLANLLSNNYFNDYELAENCFQKAISIWEKLAQENSSYLNNLSSAYNDFAQLQHTVLNFQSAKDNFDKAIFIMEQQSKDNPDYQSELASSYNKLAYLLKDGFNDYDTAKDICNKAIEISRQLSIANPDKYLNHWINYIHSLAEIYFDTNQIESAKSILSEIKPQAEKCLAENPDDNLTKSVNDNINELLAKINQRQ